MAMKPSASPKPFCSDARTAGGFHARREAQRHAGDHQRQGRMQADEQDENQEQRDGG